MLTRIEIDGFKSFDRFSMDLGPLLVVVGLNGSGKSNLFDAIRLLSALAGKGLSDAVKEIRGEPHELFRRGADGVPGTRMTFAVELLLEPKVRDPWGAEVEIKHTRARYEVEIAIRKDHRGIERLIVVREDARPILAKEDRWVFNGRKPSRSFRKASMKYSRKGPWLETTESEGSPIFNIRHDGHAGRKRPAEVAEATVLSSVTDIVFPHLYAIGVEMRSWRFLQLDPVAMRGPSSVIASDQLEPDGANLATVLSRIEAETRTSERPHGVLPEIASDLGSLISGVRGLDIEHDEQLRDYRINLSIRGGRPFSSRVVSDGTLRILALLTLLHDPSHRGLICLEEPENGVHPARLGPMIELVRGLLTDPYQEEEEEEPRESLSQMLFNSHSPVVLTNLSAGEMVFFDQVVSINPVSRSSTYRTRVRPILPTNQGELPFEEIRKYVSRAEVRDFLSTVNDTIFQGNP